MAKNTRREARRWALVAGVGLLIVMLALVAAWQWTPLQDYAEPRSIARWLRSASDNWWMPPLVAALYVAASLVMFPNTVLCLAVIMALGPVAGALYAYGGSATAALAGYSLGRRGGKRVEKLNFSGVEKISKQLRRGGFTQVLTLRLLPIAPFTATNILSGAARVHLLPFLAATLVGISPYILMFAVFGRQARRLLSDPTPMEATVTAAILVVAAIAVWHARALAAAHTR